MKVTAQVICETNKVIIQTPLEKFNMEYSDEMGKELFIALLLNNSFLMSMKARMRTPGYGEKLILFVVDGRSSKCVEVSLLDEDIDTSTTEILKNISTRKGNLCLVD